MAPTMTFKPSYKTQEQLLLDYVRRLEKIRKDRRAVHLRLSRLLPFNRREQHLRAAANSFEVMVKNLHAQLFVLVDSDIFVVYKKEIQGDIESAVQKVRFLFSDDPLLVDEDQRNSHFCSWYNVDTQYQDILDLVRDLISRGEQENNHREASSVAVVKAARGDPLTPDVLARVESSLARADLSNLVRRQYASDIHDDDTGPSTVFSELFISIQDLRETLLPGVNLMANRWLFQHLTETLDRRMLALLGRSDHLNISGDISFNLNVSTLLMPEFLTFDDNLNASRRGGMIVELQKVDIFADLGAYFFAREFIRERGYRVCIDGLTHDTMEMIDRERLGADLVKLVWHTDMVDGGQETYERIRTFVQRSVPERVVLCRCDGREAIDFGRAVGISVFQGRFVEHIIADENRKRELMRLKSRGRRK